jgi:hypothetical protein
MGKFFQSRRLVALATAYGIALQALLLPLSVAAGAPFKSSLCVAATSVDGAPLPASHDSGCPCAAGCGMQCCVQMLTGPQQGANASSLTRVRAMTPARLIKPVIRLADRSPQAPRAPPAT